MKRLLFTIIGLLLLIGLNSFQNSNRLSGTNSIILKNITFTHQTTAGRFCDSPSNPSFPPATQTIPINNTGQQPAISYAFSNSGNFGQQAVTIRYAYNELDTIRKSFYINNEFAVDGCNFNPGQSEGAWLKGTRMFSFDFDIPSGNNYDILLSKSSVEPTISGDQKFNENYVIILTDLKTGSVLPPQTFPTTFQSRPPSSYRCTIECTDLKANTRHGERNAQRFISENTFTAQFNKL